MIRLFRLEPGCFSNPLRGTFVHACLDHAPSYEALSYVWGNPQPHYTCRINDDDELGIGTTLYEALVHLRLPTTARLLWIDAVCINQKDMLERREQVIIMGKIYRRADNVIIWLGKSTEYSSYGMEALANFSRGPLSNGGTSWSTGPPTLWREGLCEIMQNEYFTRIWVVQEVALARKVTAQCGFDQFSWINDRAHVRSFVRSIKLATILPSWTESDLSTVNMDNVLDLLELQLRQCVEGLLAPDLLDLVYDLRHRKSSDIRDKIFALLELKEAAAIRSKLIVDYMVTAEEIYLNLVRVLEEHESLP